MIENDITDPIQASHMEAVSLFADAIEKATALGFTLAVSGSSVDVIPWMGRPVVREVIATGETVFEAYYLTNLVDFLEGVAYGRVNVSMAPSN